MSSNPLPRITQQIFSGSAPTNELAVFGSMKTGNPVYTNNIETLTGSSAYQQGFQDAVLEDDAPYLEETNGLFYGITSQLAYLFQKGIPEWDADTQYFTNSFCQYNGVIYRSTVDNNINLQPDINTTQWTELKTGTGGGGSSQGVGDMPLFTGMYFEFTPNDAGWVAGGSLLSGTVYTTAYNTLISCLTDNIYNLKVIEESAKEPSVDYSDYWIVDQSTQMFTVPTKISYMPLNGDTAPVVGNGMAVGLIAKNSSGVQNNYGMIASASEQCLAGTTSMYGQPVGTQRTGNALPGGYTVGITQDAQYSGIVADLSSIQSSSAKLYFKVGNTIINQALVDIGELMEFTNGLQEVECVIESYSSGSSWYRIWSDGWCEQGGYVNTNKSTSTFTITYLKQFSNTDYYFNQCQYSSGDDYYQRVINKTTSTIQVVGQNDSVGFNWEAKGYLASGEY